MLGARDQVQHRDRQTTAKPCSSGSEDRGAQPVSVHRACARQATRGPAQDRCGARAPRELGRRHDSNGRGPGCISRADVASPSTSLESRMKPRVVFDTGALIALERGDQRRTPRARRGRPPLPVWRPPSATSTTAVGSSPSAPITGHRACPAERAARSASGAPLRARPRWVDPRRPAPRHRRRTGPGRRA